TGSAFGHGETPRQWEYRPRIPCRCWWSRAGRDSHSGFGWHNYGPQEPGDIGTIAWHDFPGASRSTPDTWTLRLRAGEPGDWFPNGEVIRFVGGAGYLDLSLFSDGFETTPPSYH